MIVERYTVLQSIIIPMNLSPLPYKLKRRLISNSAPYSAPWLCFVFCRGVLGVVCSSLVVLKAAQRDLPGSLERISRCVEVLVKYPGMCRFPMA